MGNLQVLEILFLLEPGNQSYMYQLYIQLSINILDIYV